MNTEVKDLRTQSANDAYLQANGTDQFYHQPNSSFQYTAEIKDLLTKCGAYWLLSEILLANKFSEAVKIQDFQSWELKHLEGNTFILTCDDGNDNIVWEKRIPFSDFPYKDVKIWVEHQNIFFPSQR